MNNKYIKLLLIIIIITIAASIYILIGLYLKNIIGILLSFPLGYFSIAAIQRVIDY